MCNKYLENKKLKKIYICYAAILPVTDTFFKQLKSSKFLNITLHTNIKKNY